MKKTLTLMALTLGIATASQAKITLNLPKDLDKPVQTTIYSVADIASAMRPADLNAAVSQQNPVDGIVVIENVDYPAQYTITIGEDDYFTLFAEPFDQITVDVATKPGSEMLTFDATGTPLVEGMAKIDKVLEPIIEKYSQLMQAYSMGQLQDTAELEALPGAADALMKSYFESHPGDPSALFALMNVNEPVAFMECYEAITPQMRESILYPVVENQKKRIDQQIEKANIQKSLDGKEAPNFELPLLDGGTFSLTSLRGKWVVLDFWGSWCGWCIKGMPKMKEAYKEYAGKFEIVGIDCGDTEDAWREAVKKHELPWINVYAGQQPQIVQMYGVEGFPTKVIINPEGKIVDLVTGEDPAFYTKLADYINK